MPPLILEGQCGEFYVIGWLAAALIHAKSHRGASFRDSVIFAI